MKMKNCDLTIPAVLKSLLVAYAGSLVGRGRGGGSLPHKRGMLDLKKN